MPDWKALIHARLRRTSPGTTLDPEVVDELATHLQDRYDELLDANADEVTAIETALAELADESGAPLMGRRRAQPTRDTRPRNPGLPAWLADWWRDARYGARTLARMPGFAAVVILTLGLGIAATTTAFTVINSVLLGPLSVERPSELVTLSTRGTQRSADGDALLPLSYPNLQDVRAQADVFRDLAGHSSPLSITLAEGDGVGRIFGELVTANYFDTLGIQPRLGRFFRPEEDRAPGTHPVLVLGHAPWQRRFGGRADIVGHELQINGVVFTVIGVAPDGFRGLDPLFGPDVWIPTMMTAQVVPLQMQAWLTDRAALGFRAVARLQPGVTAARAASVVETLAAGLARDYPDTNRGRRLTVAPLSRATLLGLSPQESIVGSVALVAVPGLVLLIACSNVANLLLARATARRQELAVRLALGAGRGRIVRQLFTESAVLGLAAGVLGLGLAYASAVLLWSFRPPEFAENLVDVALDLRVIAFAFVVAVLTTLIFGAAPALEASRPEVVSALGDGRTAGAHRRLVSWRHALVVGQLALSLTALMASALFIRSVQQSHTIDPGFERRHLGVLMMSPGQAGYDRPRTEQLYRDIRSRVLALPDVRSMSWATNLPLFASPSREVRIEGRPVTPDADGVRTVVTTVDLDYFTTAGVSLVRGRDFADADRDDTVPVAIINAEMARAYWGDSDPIGQRITFAGDTTARQIVGIAETANYDDLGEAPQPCVYLPLAQNFNDSVVLYVRTVDDPGPTLATIQRAVRQIDSRIDVSDSRTVGRILEQALFGATMGVGLLGVFGLAALGLASLGMYGVMAHTVSLRRREIGVRMALGADRAAVLVMVVRQGLTLIAVGLVIGGTASMLVGITLTRVLHGVTVLDPLAFAGAATVLMTAAALACYLPASRASKVDPLDALRTV